MIAVRIEFVSNVGSRAIDAVAETVHGRWDARSCSTDLNGVDFGTVYVPKENLDYLYEILDADPNVISWK